MCFLQQVFWRGKMPLMCTRCHCVITEHIKMERICKNHPIKPPSDETVRWSSGDLQPLHLQFALHLSHLVGFTAILWWKTSSFRDLLFLCRIFSLHTVFLFGVWLFPVPLSEEEQKDNWRVRNRTMVSTPGIWSYSCSRVLLQLKNKSHAADSSTPFKFCFVGVDQLLRPVACYCCIQAP